MKEISLPATVNASFIDALMKNQKHIKMQKRISIILMVVVAMTMIPSISFAESRSVITGFGQKFNVVTPQLIGMSAEDRHDDKTPGKVDITASGTVVTAVVDNANGTKLVNKAISEKASNVIVNAASGKTGITQADVSISTDMIKQIFIKSNCSLLVKTDMGLLIFDRKTVGTISSKASGATVDLKIQKVSSDENSLTLFLKMTSGNGVFTDFGGVVTVTTNIDAAFAAKSLTCAYVDDNGKYIPIISGIQDSKTFTFGTTHFSNFVIMDKATAEGIYTKQTVSGIEKTSLKASAKGYKNYNKVTWKKSAGYKVDYYQVYRSARKGTFSKTPYARAKTTVTSYKDRKATKGKTYYYKVVGVRTVDGQKIYTKTSSVVKAARK